MYLKGRNGFFKLWYFLRTYVLTLKRFDLFLQGSLLIVTLLESNVYLLLQRDQNDGNNSPYIQDWILVAAGGTEFLFGAFLAWIGRHRRQYALSGWLAVTATASLIVLAFPFAESNPASVELCGGETISSYLVIVDNNYKARTIILIITALLSSLTKISIWAHGLTYLDDHEPQNGPYFYGILISIRLSLGLSSSSWLQPSSLTENWWKSHLSISMLTMMFAIFFTLFPKKLSQMRRTENRTLWLGAPKSQGANAGQLPRNAGALLDEFVLQEEAPKEARFHIEAIRQDPRTSRLVSDIYRPLVVIFFVMIFRIRFSDRRTDGVKANTASRVGGIVALVVCVFFAALASLSCTIQDIQGSNDGSIQPECSLQCGCNSERYGFSPVCGLDSQTTFFSPCTAGCLQYEDFNGFLLFQNCTCGFQKAIRGACSLNDCRLAYSIYQVIYTTILAVSGASFLMQGMVLLRAVERVDKPVAIGFSFGGIGLFSFVIGHLLYMVVSRLTCNFSSSSGECILHHPTLWIMLVVSLLLTLVSSIFSLATSFTAYKYFPTTDL
ncbi:hypothetical protein K1T71_012014 [Dendrolimus kikuchii]|uniref:Uncharacterized protein n=1 Tax=Dendrolimus kikuchii TaxID=765133 RepID=A0ACC1CKS6_9NEOP|nr:hypothetical protein K1T71_012014 [Dendrolimus kikuchii]